MPFPKSQLWIKGSKTSFADKRKALATKVTTRCMEISAEYGLDFADPNVLTALADVPRHEFVPQPVRQFAYSDCPLAIGDGQTISQPTIVAVMTALLRLQPTDRVLEIGTGSGYQAAILSRIAAQVFSIEVNVGHANRARDAFSRLSYDNISVACGDGTAGWAAVAPFDAIILTAAPGVLPEPLIAQLKGGGRLVAPVGIRHQHLVLIEKDAEGNINRRELMPVRFVPMVFADAGL